MIKIDEVRIRGFSSAIHGMRNSFDSWDESDSYANGDRFVVGDKDFNLMKKLVKAGDDHAKFMRMIAVWCDILAPLYWWKEFDTYKVGTVANSCSTMHTITKKEFEIGDFSYDNLLNSECDLFRQEWGNGGFKREVQPTDFLADYIIPVLNTCREKYLEAKDKKYWWQIIQLLPTSYNQKRTVMLNYAVLRNIYHARSNHKLDEWLTFCDWVGMLPYSELITDEKVYYRIDDAFKASANFK